MEPNHLKSDVKDYKLDEGTWYGWNSKVEEEDFPRFLDTNVNRNFTEPEAYS